MLPIRRRQFQSRDAGRLLAALITLVALRLAFGARGAPALDVSHPILASGDIAAGFGTIGYSELHAYGVDRAGRVLVGAALNSGVTGIYWASADDLTPLWVPEGPDALRLVSMRTTPGGRVVGVDSTWFELSEVTSAGRLPLARAGDTTTDGTTICQVGTFAINESGTVAFDALSAPPGRICSDYDHWTQNVFVLSAAGLRLVLDHAELRGASAAVLGIADDGAIGIALRGHDRLLVIGSDGAVRRAIAAGDRAARAALSDVIGLALGRGGDLIFLASAEDTPGLYRAVGDRIETILQVGDGVPGILSINAFDTVASTNAMGDVVLAAEWSEAAGEGTAWRWGSGAVLVRANGERQIVSRDHAAWPVGINDDAVVALDAIGIDRSLGRWEAGELRTLVRAGDPVPGGARIAVGGLSGAHCLADDGRVGTAAVNPTSDFGLLCVDATGAHKIARRGEPSPGGGTLHDFSQCAFAGEDEVLFSAGRVWEDNLDPELGVYRATPEAIERAIGVGQTTTSGRIVRGVLSGVGISSVGLSGHFDANAAGTLLAFIDTGAGRALVRQRRGGGLEEVRFALEGDPLDRRVEWIEWAGIAADDTVVAGALLEGPAGSFRALIASDGAVARIVAETDDPRLPGAPLMLYSTLARGDHVFTIGQGADGRYHALLVSLADGSARELLTAQGAGWPWGVRDLTAGGRLLFDAYTPDGAGLPGRFVLDDAGLTAFPDHPGWEAVAINDRGNLLTTYYGGADGLAPHRLALAGPPPDARCFVPPTAVPVPVATRTPTPQPIDCGAIDDPRCIYLIVGPASGRPGERVAVDVRLQSGSHDVAGVQLDLHVIAAAAYAVGADGQPACRVNPAIHKDATAHAFQPFSCRSDSACEAVRTLVLALDNVDPIPDGVLLYQCELEIAAEARPGHYELPASMAGFSDPEGHPLPGTARAGRLEVLAAGAAQSAQRVAGGGGCQLGGKAEKGAWPFILAALAMIAAARLVRLCQ